MIFFSNADTDAGMEKDERAMVDALYEAMAAKLEEWGEKYEAAEDSGNTAERDRYYERLMAMYEIAEAAGYYIECGLWGWTIEKTKESESDRADGNRC